MKDFFDMLEEEGLVLGAPLKGDGSYEVDGVDMSWGSIESLDVIRSTQPNRIFTVIYNDDYEEDGEDMVVAHGVHTVNKAYYLVTNQPYLGNETEFKF